MDITVPAPQPLKTGRVKAESVTPSFGQTGNAQFTRAFKQPLTELKSFMSTQDVYDPESVGRVEDYIKQNPMSNEAKRFLRRNGIGSEQNFNAALESIQKNASAADIMSRSTGLNLMLSDPANILSLSVPIAGFAGLKLARGINMSSTQGRILLRDLARDAAQFPATRVKPLAPDLSANNVNILRQIVASKKKVSGEQLTAKEIAKIGALDAAMADGSINLTQALTDLGISDKPEDVLINAGLVTAASTAIGGAVGYGLGAALGAPLNRGKRMEQVRSEYSKYLDHVSKPPAENTDLSYSGKWFTESPFMKVVPSPIRTEINDPDIPDYAKEPLLQVGGDNGILFEANRVGKSIGNSVHMEAGRRDGDWFTALETINSNYRSLSPRGLSEPLGIPITSAIEKVRAKLGKESFAPEEWYNHIGDLYAKDVPYEKMTPEEAASVQAVEGFFNKYRVDLEDVGLINDKDIFVEAVKTGTARSGDIVSTINGIIIQNAKWMFEQTTVLKDMMRAKSQQIDSVKKQQSERGLSKKQGKLLANLEKEFSKMEMSVKEFDELFNLINKAESIDELASLYDRLNLTAPMREALPNLKKQMDDTNARIKIAKEAIDFRNLKNKDAPKGMKRHFPRFFNRRKIEADRDAFTGILIKWFRENPERYVPQPDGSIKKVSSSTAPEELAKRAEQTVNNILGETDEDMIEAMFTGFGRSSPLMSRRLDIPNHLVSDFIVKDVKEVMIAYTARVAPKIEFHKRFRHPETDKLITLEDYLSIMTKRMEKDKVPKKKILRWRKNFVGTYDQVVGTNRQRPDAIDTKIADGLRTATTWTFLGGSGVAALGDLASLFMDHELKTIGKLALGFADGLGLKMGKRELNLAGEALELTKGTAHIRYAESLSNDMFNNGLANRLNNGFYNLNLLGPVTVVAKTLDSFLRGHTILEASEKFLAGKATKFEKEFLARYNISEANMRSFAAMPTEATEGGLRLPNTEAWTDEAAVVAFRNALRSGVMNRIIMGTPADKPLLMGGVAYVPESVASKLPFDLPVDPRVPGYRRAESGLLALPFTFYSYTFGALSKITANYATGSVRNKAAHTAIAMGLGAAIVKFRTPSWAWDDMDTEDKIMRAFDFSGLAALYSDAMYRGLSMSEELGFEPSFPIQPKYSSGTDPLGAVVSIGGAPADYAYGVASGISEMLSGNYGDGAKDLVRHGPLIGAISFGGVIEDSAMGIAGALPNRP